MSEAKPSTPAAIAKAAGKRATGEIRKCAWITRRKKYGPRGHNGSYKR